MISGDSPELAYQLRITDFLGTSEGLEESEKIEKGLDKEKMEDLIDFVESIHTKNEIKSMLSRAY